MYDFFCRIYNHRLLDKSKKTVPWNGHSWVILPSQKPEGISKDANNIIRTS